MAQEFTVLQCCQCRTYQVQQSKKATKWVCKICNCKQGFKQFFARGPAKECRFAVQRLNSQQFAAQDQQLIIDGVLIDAKKEFNKEQDIDAQILDMILKAEEENEMSGPKKRKVKEESNENVGANCGFEVANKHNSFNDHTRRVTKVLK